VSLDHVNNYVAISNMSNATSDILINLCVLYIIILILYYDPTKVFLNLYLIKFLNIWGKSPFPCIFVSI